jgi:hypothetical protein
MLRIDEPKVRALRYGIAQGERSMGEDTEDMPDVLQAEILYNRFRNVRFGHVSGPPYMIGLISSGRTKKQLSSQSRNLRRRFFKDSNTQPSAPLNGVPKVQPCFCGDCTVSHVRKKHNVKEFSLLRTLINLFYIRFSAQKAGMALATLFRLERNRKENK